MAQVNIDVAKEESVQAVNTKVGTSSDTASNTPTTLFAGIKGLIGWFTVNWTAARATKLDSIQTTLNTPDGNTLGAWLNYLQTTSQSSINLLNNATYGLNAIKTAVSSGCVKGIQRGTIPSRSTRTGVIKSINPNSSDYFSYFDVSIEGVNISKAICRATFKVRYQYNGSCELISNNIIRIYYFATSTSSDAALISDILWEVVELY